MTQWHSPRDEDNTTERLINQHDDHSGSHRGNDGVDRRGFLECMAWVGTGLLFVQISDSRIGFAADANRDVTATLRLAINRINAVPLGRVPPWSWGPMTGSGPSRISGDSGH